MPPLASEQVQQRRFESFGGMKFDPETEPAPEIKLTKGAELELERLELEELELDELEIEHELEQELEERELAPTSRGSKAGSAGVVQQDLEARLLPPQRNRRAGRTVRNRSG